MPNKNIIGNVVVSGLLVVFSLYAILRPKELIRGTVKWLKLYSDIIEKHVWITRGFAIIMCIGGLCLFVSSVYELLASGEGK